MLEHQSFWASLKREAKRPLWMTSDDDLVSNVKGTFSIAEYAFKVANWMTLIGLFEFLYRKTESWMCLSVGFLLRALLLMALFHAVNFAAVFIIGYHKDRGAWRNAFIRFGIPMLIWVALNMVISQVVEVVAATKL